MSYKIHGAWQLEDDYRVGDILIALERTDLIDHHGRIYSEGAWRVKVDGKVRKTFKGETAWSDSLRLYGDIRYGLMLK